MSVDTIRLLLIILLGFIHWSLVMLLIDDVKKENKLWIVFVFFVTVVGSVMYIITHPRIFIGKELDD
jgi:hypothetical protein